MNINNGVGLNSNHSCRILWICVWVYGSMDTIFSLSISDFSIVGKSILNSKEFLLLPWVLEPLRSLIYVPSLSLLMCFPPFYILLQKLCSLFVLVLLLLSLAHALPTLLYDLFETLTMHFFIVSLNAMVTALSDRSFVLEKVHDLMNQNLPSFSCPKIISIMSFNSINRCYFIKFLENKMKRLVWIYYKVEYVWSLPIRASSGAKIFWCKKLTSPLLDKDKYLYNKLTPIYLRDLSL